MEEHEVFKCQHCGEVCVYDPEPGADHNCPECGAPMVPLQNIYVGIDLGSLKEGD